MSIVLTGSTGTVGSYLAYRLLRQGRPLVLVGRGADFQARAKARIESWGPLLTWRQVRFLDWAEVQSSFEKQDFSPSHLVHSAADTNLSLKTAKNQVQTNLDLLDRALHLCRLWEIPRIDFLSSAYACGSHRGPIPESRLPRPEFFRNPYEESKWECEERIFGLDSEFPRTRVIHRPSLILPPILHIKGNAPRAFGRLFEKLRFLSHRTRSGDLSVSIPLGGRIGFVSLIAFIDDFLSVMDQDMGLATHVFHYTSSESPSISTWTDWIRESIPDLRVQIRPTCPAGKRILGELEPYLRNDFVFEQSKLSRLTGKNVSSSSPLTEKYFRALIHGLLSSTGSVQNRAVEVEG
ncbi:MAG: SDR family oxidoreductase [Candidatus Omnitrophica bacterium]|nr:SDR family oxidoreductase [Candidatus Omnitrophota bacterium]MCA9429833.1 SDR family oxidoreductase [Candidatus Omnitrophota bacterium]MCA9440329.1 SDR family oxidoreductase [Candidatus Omnitrophota bacterium]MCA9445830.1 SDR family oxidoreductase [Candidatus Omnitrophota bacterium]